MNLVSLYRDHPDLAELLGAVPVHLVKCGDCPHHLPPDGMYVMDSLGTLGCEACFYQRQDAAWAESLDRLAKESREEVAT